MNDISCVILFINIALVEYCGVILQFLPHPAITAVVDLSMFSFSFPEVYVTQRLLTFFSRPTLMSAQRTPLAFLHSTGLAWTQPHSYLKTAFPKTRDASELNCLALGRLMRPSDRPFLRPPADPWSLNIGPSMWASLDLPHCSIFGSRTELSKNIYSVIFTLMLISKFP